MAEVVSIARLVEADEELVQIRTSFGFTFGLLKMF
jgi:hypothetical protein